jgi:hypothetical protein
MIENVKPSSLRKYIFEYCVIALCASVVFLYYQLYEINKYIRDTFTNQSIESRTIIHENTKALERVNEYFIQQKKP